MFPEPISPCLIEAGEALGASSTGATIRSVNAASTRRTVETRAFAFEHTTACDEGIHPGFDAFSGYALEAEIECRLDQFAPGP